MEKFVKITLIRESCIASNFGKYHVLGLIIARMMRTEITKIYVAKTTPKLQFAIIYVAKCNFFRLSFAIIYVAIINVRNN